MAAPFEILASPLTLWLAPVDTEFPAIDDAVGAFDAAWGKVGTSGTRNYSDDGVTVTHGQTIEGFTPAGATTPRKVWRTEETLVIAVTIADVSPEQYAQVLNDAAITTVAASTGVAGEKSFALFQGLEVAEFALLARGLSSVDEDLNAQYEVPRVYQGADSIAPVYKKGEPAMLALEFNALSDDTGGFGTLRIQTHAAS